MSLRKANQFDLRIANDEASPATPLGVSVTASQNAFAAPTSIFDSGAVEWWPVGSGDAYAIDVVINSVVIGGQAKDTLARIYLEQDVNSVDTGADTISFTNPHGGALADEWHYSTTGTDIGGLTAGTVYFIIPVDDDTFKVATSEANARAGTAINLTSAGTGTHTGFVLKLKDLAASEASNASGASSGSGAGYWFPLWIPRLAKIVASVSVNNATPGTAGVFVRLHCKPTKKWLLRTCTFVRTFGSTPASSSGTALTPGTNAKGAYSASLGTIQEDLSHWQIGCCLNNATTANAGQFWDLAIDNAGVKRIVTDKATGTSSAETMSQLGSSDEYAHAIATETVHARAGNAGAPVTGFSAIAYGAGGRRVEPNPYTVAEIVIIRGAPAPNGKTVEIWAVDADGDSELVTTATTGGGTGAFSAAVPDNTRSYFASYNNDGIYGRSALGTPV